MLISDFFLSNVRGLCFSCKVCFCFLCLMILKATIVTGHIMSHRSEISSLNTAPKGGQGGQGCLKFPLCLESQGCHLSPPPSLSLCGLVLLHFLSCCFSANGPFSWLFPQKMFKHFSLRVRLFVWLLLSRGEMVGGMCGLLPYDTAITYLDNLFSILLFFFNLVLMDGMFDNISMPALCALLILKGPTLQLF